MAFRFREDRVWSEGNNMRRPFEVDACLRLSSQHLKYILYID